MSLRSRQTTNRSVDDDAPPAIIVDPFDEAAALAVARDSDLQKKSARTKPRVGRPWLILLYCIITCAALSGYVLYSSPPNHHAQESSGSPQESNSTSATLAPAPMGSIVYGAKSKGDDTARLVTKAIEAGFRHIATGGFHFEYDEAGVGEGWKNSGVPRHELYLQ